MKIALIWDSDYPWDVRIEKVAHSLIASGHEIHLICRNTRKEKAFEIFDGINIHRLPVLSSWSWLNKILTFPAFFNPIWLRTIKKVFSDHQIEYVIVRDLPLCPSAIWISRSFNISCSMDMAECYPELLRCIWKFEKFRLVNVLVRNPRFADLVEQYCFRNLSKIFVMIEESRDRLLSMGVPHSKIEIVSNTPSLDFAKEPIEKKNKESTLTLLYLGILNPSRGLDTVLEGLAHLKRTGFRCRLIIAGTGKASQDLKILTSKLDLMDRVIFVGWVQRANIENLLKESDIGLVPHHVCNHWNTTIPNKLFDYMAADMPVLSTDVVPMTRIIRFSKCGLIYKDKDPASFAECVVRLNDIKVRQEFGRNGKNAVASAYNWEIDSQKLVAAVEASQ